MIAGYPSELFYRGSAMWETLYGMILAFPLVCFFFVPIYYSLGITSVYQVCSFELFNWNPYNIKYLPLFVNTFRFTLLFPEFVSLLLLLFCVFPSQLFILISKTVPNILTMSIAYKTKNISSKMSRDQSMSNTHSTLGFQNI